LEIALSLKPSLPDCGVLLLRTLREIGDYARLLHACETLPRRVPESAELCRELGDAYAELQHLDEALVLHEKAVSLAPESANAHASLAAALANRTELDRSLVHYRKALAIDPSHVAAHSSLLFTLPYHPDSDAEAIRAEAERFQRVQVAAVKPFAGHTNDRTPGRRLRVGYVSGDFRLHAAAMFLVPLLRSHDRQQVEVVCYSNVSRPDGLTQEMRALADRWCDIAPLDDDAAAKRIREDGIDVLVDLGMHTERNRLFVFARKPAPVQACWLAYAGTTGLEAMDYRITDIHFDPPGLHDEHYTEASLRLPETFWCYDPLTALPQVSALPALRTGHITRPGTASAGRGRRRHGHAR
jgi:predicted O-linked N-acetylglucosamine transferase (SPINDLY family)